MKLLMIALLTALPSLALAEGGAQQPMGMSGQLIFLGGFLLIVYFLLWRPQSKRQKEHKALMASLGKGDEVVTAGGLLGKVTKVSDEFVIVEVSDSVSFPVQKTAVTAVLPKGTVKEVNA